jgi:polyisoprenoid-binding protein YceI
MKLLSALALAAAPCLALGLAARAPAIRSSAAPVTYEIDAGHSSLLFRAKHIGVAYVYGRFNEYSGSFTHDAEKPENGKVDVEIQIESIDTGIEKRDAHLRSPDFFDAKQFPTATFKSKSVKKKADGRFDVAGDFTMRGTTKPVTIDLEHVGSAKSERMGEREGFHGTFTIKRSDFGMTYGGDSLGEDIQVIVSIQGVKSGG